MRRTRAGGGPIETILHLRSKATPGPFELLYRLPCYPSPPPPPIPPIFFWKVKALEGELESSLSAAGRGPDGTSGLGGDGGGTSGGDS